MKKLFLALALLGFTTPALAQYANDAVTAASGGGTPGGSSGQIQYNNAGAFGGALLRWSAGNLFLGDVDAASPVAQTLSVQNVVAGTSNTAGPNTTYAGAQGTGTGVGGSLIFQVAPAGSTGTAQNALATALTIDSTKLATFAGSVASSVADANSFGNPTIVSTSQIRTAVPIWVDGTNNVIAFINTLNNAKGLVINNTFPIAFSSGGTSQNVTALNNAVNAFIMGPAAATIQQGAADAAAPVAQTTQVQSVVAGTSNTAGTDWTFNASKGTGTGAGGNIILQTAPAGTTGTAQNAASQVAIVDSKSHIRVGNTTAPALTSCGTSPAIVGTDIAGTVTMGTTATGCVITFKTAYANAPICNVTWRATPLASQSYAISTTAITTTQTSASNNVLDYHCFAQNAG